jgi:carbamate kinase
MRIVAALGGNALLKRGEPLTKANQRANVRRAAVALAPLCSASNEVFITHGNGPQVGLLALQSAAGPAGGDQPLDVLSAETQGMLGYLIEQELRNAMPSGREVASVLSQLIVDSHDPAFGNPTKPIGPVYTQIEAQRLASERGWSMVKDGAAWRRAVASPRPHAILGLGVISLLASRGVIVICVGGGGIPVARADDGRLYGVEAVIDKDHASALLAREVNADCLLLLTDVDSVYLGWRTARAQSIASAGPNDLDPTEFEPGSMRPKVEAALEFARLTGKCAAIGRLEDAAAILIGKAGTSFERSQVGLRIRGPIAQ